MKLIVRVRIYHILTYVEEKNINLKKIIIKNFVLQIYRSQMDNMFNYSDNEDTINKV